MVAFCVSAVHTGGSHVTDKPVLSLLGAQHSEAEYPRVAGRQRCPGEVPDGLRSVLGASAPPPRAVVGGGGFVWFGGGEATLAPTRAWDLFTRWEEGGDPRGRGQGGRGAGQVPLSFLRAHLRALPGPTICGQTCLPYSSGPGIFSCDTKTSLPWARTAQVPEQSGLALLTLLCP